MDKETIQVSGIVLSILISLITLIANLRKAGREELRQEREKREGVERNILEKLAECEEMRDDLKLRVVELRFEVDSLKARPHT